MERKIEEFGITMKWDGGGYVKVSDDKEAIYYIPLVIPNERYARFVMNREEERMHKACVGFCQEVR